MAITYAKHLSGAYESVPYTPGSALTAGDVVVVGNNVFFALSDVAASVLGALHIGGVWRLPKSTGTSSGIAQGTLVYWDATYHVVTTTAGSNKKIGITAKASGDSDATQDVLSIPQAV